MPHLPAHASRLSPTPRRRPCPRRKIGNSVVGRRVEVYWPFEEQDGGEWFPGWVEGFDHGKATHRVKWVLL